MAVMVELGPGSMTANGRRQYNYNGVAGESEEIVRRCFGQSNG
jgi:hypothetical protein